MLTTEIHEATVEFARSLRQAPAVGAYRAAQAALDADPGAQALMAELRHLQQAFIETQQRGETPAPDAMDALRLCQADVRANEVIMAHLRATSEVKAFLPGVASEVSRALGTDYARLIAPTSC
jgi:cell fate (sporulation/competence/biofilm development) regulator YlbF (YheA/YmcA/DUF963 family)